MGQNIGFNNYTEPEPEVQKKAETDNLVASKMQIGSGGNAMKADQRGLFLGAEDAGDSPFHVDMEGNLRIRANAKGSGSITFYDEEGVARIFIGFEE